LEVFHRIFIGTPVRQPALRESHETEANGFEKDLFLFLTGR
jgi:hypothetical protein